MRRYELAALVAASGLTESQLAIKVKLSGSSLKKARETGLIESAADRYAVRAGFHPYEVWPEMADHALEDAGRECDECDTQFTPNRSHQRFCSQLCQQRNLQRRRQRIKYQTDPDFAARKRALSRRYYEECREYVRAQQQRRRSAA